MMLSRGLPVSVLFHAIALVVVVMFGNHVARNPIRPSSSIKVKMVRLPEPKVQQADAPAEPLTQPEPQKEIQPELPPKELPKPKIEDTPKVEKKPQEKIDVPEPVVEPAEKTEEPVKQVTKTMTSGAQVSDVETNFPFDWYVSRVDGLIWGKFKPRQIGFGKRAMISCAVHFVVGKNGSVSQVTLVRNSGVGVFDREALRAVQTTKLPPLPPQFTGPSVGFTYIFILEPGT